LGGEVARLSRVAPEHDVGLASLVPSVRVGAIGAYEKIADAVAVAVAGRVRRNARPVIGVDAAEHETEASVAGARKQAREREHRRETPALRGVAPEHDVALAGLLPSAGVALQGAYDEIID